MGNGQQIGARVELLGELAGTLELRARLAYKAAEQRLELQDLAFEYEAKDPAMALLEEAFHEHIRQALEAAANEALAQQIELLGERLETALEKILPTGVLLDMSALQLRSLQIDIVQQGIKLDGAVTGSARLLLR